MSNPYQQPQDPYGPGPHGQAPYGQPVPGPGPQHGGPQGAAYGYPQQPQPYQAPAQPAQPYAQPPGPYAQPQGYPPQPAYGYPQAGYYTGEPNQLATAAVAIGFVSVLGICLYGFGGFLGFVGAGLGIAALNKAKTTGTGRNQAIGGLVLSGLGILTGIAIVVAVALAGSA